MAIPYTQVSMNDSAYPIARRPRATTPIGPRTFARERQSDFDIAHLIARQSAGMDPALKGQRLDPNVAAVNLQRLSPQYQQKNPDWVNAIQRGQNVGESQQFDVNLGLGRANIRRTRAEAGLIGAQTGQVAQQTDEARTTLPIRSQGMAIDNRGKEFNIRRGEALLPGEVEGQSVTNKRGKVDIRRQRQEVAGLEQTQDIISRLTPEQKAQIVVPQQFSPEAAQSLYQQGLRASTARPFESAGQKDRADALGKELVGLTSKLTMPGSIYSPEQLQQFQTRINEINAELGGGMNMQGIEPPPEAVEYLRANPDMADDFDAKYGPGAAERALRTADSDYLNMY